MKRTPSFGLIFCALLIAGCEMVAGLDERAFSNVDDSDGGSGPGAGGSQDGGEPSGDAGTGRADGGDSGTAGTSPGGAGGAKPASGGTAGEAGTGGTHPGDTCEDVTSKLCMRPPWPDGVIPFDFEPDVPGWIRDSVASSTYAWEGLFAGSSTLHFVRLNDQYSFEPPPPDVPTLLFALDDGCGPVSLSDDAVTVEIGSCSEDFEITMVIGAALGLPRFHQRADRDRYLKVAPASAFPCEQGRSREICSPFHGMPAQIGVFNFDYDRSVMWPHPRVPGALGNDSTCGLEPDGRYLFVARDASQPGDACFQMENSYRSIKGDAEIGAIAELYALRHGWSPFLPVGADLGPEVPIQTRPSVDSELQMNPILVATDGNGLAAFSFAYSGEIVPLMIENDGDSWGLWEPILEDSPGVWLPEQAVWRPGASGIFDFVDAVETSVYHLTYDRVLDAATRQDFSSPDGEPVVDAALTTDAASKVLFYVVTSTDSPELNPESPEPDRVSEIEFDGSDWSDWEPLPTLDGQMDVLDIAAVANVEGERHVMLTTSLGYRYTKRSAEGVWDAWSTLFLPKGLRDIALFSNETFPLGMIGKLRPFEQNFAELLWLTHCTEACTDATAWTQPLTVGAIQQGYFSAVAPSAERIDIVMTRSEFRPYGGGHVGGMRHKRWRPLSESE